MYNHKKFNRLTISVHCLKRCVEILNELVAAERWGIIHDAAYSYAIILYASPFTGNEKNQNANATPRIKSGIVINHLSDAEKILHHKLLELRKTALAHTEWEKYPTRMDSNGIISSRYFCLSHELQAYKLESVISLASNVLQNVEREWYTCWSHVQSRP